MADIAVLITSTPTGYQRSPWRSIRITVLFGSVRKYSPSSTCVPSDSRTNRTGSLAGIPSFSLPRNSSSFKVFTTKLFLRLRQTSQTLNGRFPRDSSLAITPLFARPFQSQSIVTHDCCV
uniref:Uncharacterized protein n=1 Tax=Cacopsylla melanoneura TaxID=428564 RepID=A0A8D8RH67_9HEMI